ncbi:glutathione S-transferase family protein [Pseudanabaena sp. FACHB-2040]|nr:glutathione S-transferase family protein [Pseudanabaena sp. FACHB-2040]
MRLVLAEKNIAWKSHIVNWLTFENLQPNYIRLNPKGVVPTLVHNGKVICDSAVIIRHLDQHFPGPKLTPADPALQETMNAWIDRQNRFPMRAIMYGNLKGIDRLVAHRTVAIKEKLLPRLIQQHPDLKELYAAKLADVQIWNQTLQDAEKIAQINTQIEPLLDPLTHQLSQSDWLCGADYSLADAVWTTVLSRLEELGFGPLWEGGKRDAIAPYLSRLKARPSYSAAIQNDTMPVSMVLSGLRRIFLGI